MGSITPPPQTLPYPLCIVLVGGSLTSLLTATILLSLPTHIVSHVTILERLPESQLRDQGAGIRVGAEVRDAISRYCDGLSPEKYCTRLSSIRFVDREGNLSVDSKVEMWSSTWGQMHRVLSKRVEEAGKGRAAYRCGCKVEGIWERDGGEMVVDLRDDESGKMERLQCDFVVGADGTGSTVKKLMAPGTRRLDVGYVLYRGLVQQEELSEKTRELLADSATFHWAPRSQLISYGVPCNDGPADEVGKSVNWAWYQVRDQQEKKSLLTDKDGHEHKFSLPRKSMREEEQRKIKEQAEKQLPEVYKEMVRRTDDVFLQVITDSEVPDSNVFFDGKVVLIGDAVAGQRYVQPGICFSRTCLLLRCMCFC